MSGGLEADLDLTDAVEAAARTWWEQRRGPAHAPWEDLVKSDPRLAQAVRKDARPMVTAAAPIIATAALTRAHAALDELAHERNTWARQLADIRDEADTARTERDQARDAKADVDNRLTALITAVEAVLADKVIDVDTALRRAVARAENGGDDDE